jgi:alpha-mannosidase
MFGAGEGSLIAPPKPDKSFAVKVADIVVYNEPVRRLMGVFKILHGMAKHLEGSARGEQALFIANELINRLDLDKSETVEGCLQQAEEFLRQPNSATSPVTYALGHCHIDSAWLWDYAECHRKCARSWASQVQLMKRFPDYRFVCSQMQQLEWVRNDHPALFKQLQVLASAGQFIPLGAAWVEMDGNMPNGEAMLRQFLYGQRFLKEHFGAPSRIFWLPDTFGYSGQLPQIMRHCGVDYFLSQKLSWNNINKFPHSSFVWVGIDGLSSVIAHFPPSNTYGSALEVNDFVASFRDNKDKDRTCCQMLLFGHGDGGGGPTEEMLVNLELLKDCDGLGRVKTDDPVKMYLELSESRERLLEWHG